MRKRRKNGMGIMMLIILVCLFVIIVTGGTSFLLNGFGIGDRAESAGMEKRKEEQNNSSMTDLMDNDISVADSFGVPSRESDDDNMEKLTFLVNELYFERRGNQIMIAVTASLMISYLVIIGPVTYFYLKKNGKMERMWFIIPVTALIFGSVILFMANDFVITQPCADILKVTSPGKNPVCYGVSTSPGEEDYSLYFDQSVESVQPWMMYDNYEIDNEKRCLTLYPYQAFEKDYFYFQISGQEEDSFTYHAEPFDHVGFGTVYNTTSYDFSWLLLCYEDNYCIIPPLAAGEMIQIEVDDWRKDEYGMVGSLKEELTMQVGLNSDEKNIFNFAWYLHQNNDVGKLHIAGISKEAEAGMLENGVDLISYGLFFQ